MLRLNLLVLRCAHLERSRAFFELLGMKFSKHAHGAGPGHYAHEDERGVFELYPRKEAETGDQTGLGFALSNLQQAYSAFLSAGFEPGAVKDNPWGRSFVVRDPDGRRVEITRRGVGTEV